MASPTEHARVTPGVLRPIPLDKEHAAHVAEYTRAVRSGATPPRIPWAKWSLAMAYVDAEIRRSDRSVWALYYAALAATARLGGISITG